LNKALPGVFESHPAGPFLLKRCEVRHIDHGFEFMKYRHKRDPFTGKIHRRPAAQSYSRYSQRVIKIMCSEPTRLAVRKVARYRSNWMRAFPRWRWNSTSKLLLWLTTGDAIKEGLRSKAGTTGNPL
jgi:hypothetical protein